METSPSLSLRSVLVVFGGMHADTWFKDVLVLSVVQTRCRV